MDVKKTQKRGLEFIVDKLTNSLENVITGDSFRTEVSVLTKADLKSVSKSNGWLLTGEQNLIYLQGMCTN